MRKAAKANGYSIAQARESFGKIKVNLQFMSVDKNYKCILLSSSVAGEGKSTVTANLAISFALSDKKILLIDADLRHPTQHRLFNVVNKIGLSDIIAVNNLNWHEYIIQTNTPNLCILTSGRIPPNPSELLGSNKMGELIQEFKQEFDYIFIDSPPILLVPDTISLSKHIDGLVLIARYNFTTLNAISSTKEAINIAHIKLIGTILNNVDGGDGRYYHYGYGKKYGYGNSYYNNRNSHNKDQKPL